MSAAHGLLRLATALLPRDQRAIRLEEWSADLEHCGELGLTRREIVLGALRAGVIDGLGWRTPIGRSRWLAIGSIAVVAAVLSVPVGAVTAFAIDLLRGVVTIETRADGTAHEVHWKTYPGKVQHGPEGYAEIDPATLLAAPSAEEAWGAAELLLAEIQAALTAELGLDWASGPSGATWDYAEHPTSNGYGGDSLLVVLNSPGVRSADVPAGWAAQQQAIDLIAAVAARHGYGEPMLAFEQPWFDWDDVASYGGDIPETARVVPGVLAHPDGRWLAFTIEDPSKGAAAAEEDAAGEAGSIEPGISLMWGATLLPADARAEFVERLRAFDGYARPEPFVSD